MIAEVNRTSLFKKTVYTGLQWRSWAFMPSTPMPRLRVRRNLQNKIYFWNKLQESERDKTKYWLLVQLFKYWCKSPNTENPSCAIICLKGHGAQGSVFVSGFRQTSLHSQKHSKQGFLKKVGHLSYLLYIRVPAWGPQAVREFTWHKKSYLWWHHPGYLLTLWPHQSAILNCLLILKCPTFVQ